jgi:hypothetical protein
MRLVVPSRNTIALTTPLRLSIAAAVAIPDTSMTALGLRRDAARGRFVVEQCQCGRQDREDKVRHP